MTVAVVTGGTRGIGAAIASRLRARDVTTITLSRSVAESDRESAESIVCDVTDAEQVDRVFNEIGPVDILVNNAGISSSSPISRTTLADWNRNLAVNATGVFLCTRAVIGGMRARGHGRIVTVASTAGLDGGRYLTAYAASKHAAMGLMRSVAYEVTGTGVTANVVCPTFVRTDMTLGTIANIARKSGIDDAEAERRLAEITPHGRLLEVSEVADAVMSLIDSTDNGQEIVLDGGDP